MVAQQVVLVTRELFLAITSLHPLSRPSRVTGSMFAFKKYKRSRSKCVSYYLTLIYKIQA